MAFLAAIGPVLSAVGSVVSGVAGFAASKYQARVADMNAEIAKENAQRAREIGQENAQEQDVMSRALLGEQLAVQTASGLSTGSRSSMLTRKSARQLGRKDAEKAREAGEIEAQNYATQSANFKNEAAGAKLSGAGSLLGGFLQAGSGLADSYSGSTLVGGARPTKRRFAPIPTPRPGSLIS